MQTTQFSVQDEIRGSNLIEVRIALRAIHAHGAAITKLGVQVFGNTPPIIFLMPRGDPAGAMAFHNGMVLSASELNSMSLTEKKIDSLGSGSLPPILRAADVFEQRNMNLADYRIKLFRTKDSFVVVFTDKDSQAGRRGNPGKRPGFEVELDAVNLHLIRSQFVR